MGLRLRLGRDTLGQSAQPQHLYQGYATPASGSSVFGYSTFSTADKDPFLKYKCLMIHYYTLITAKSYN